MDLSYNIIGTGALGGFYGGILAHSGKQVNFLLHSDYDYVVKNGLQVDYGEKSFHIDNVNAYNDTNKMPKADVVLVTLKTTNNHLLKSLLKPIVDKKTIVILIQNGIYMEERLAEAFTQMTIGGGSAFICCYKSGLGHIHHVDYGSLTLGLHNNKTLENIELIKQVVSDFQMTGIQCNYADNLYFIRWKKLIWNIAYNGISVVLNTQTNILMENPSSRAMLKDIMLEVIAAARACGVPIKDEVAEMTLVHTDKMTPYAPSMKLDYDAKRPLEIEAIYDNTIALAAEKGYDMKLTKMIAKELRFLTSNFNHKV